MNTVPPETRHGTERRIDAWKLYRDVFRELFPSPSVKPDDIVSPAVLQEMVDRLAPSATPPTRDQLLLVIEIVRQHPDFDNGGPMADMMDQALRGEVPKLLGDLVALKNARRSDSSSDQK